MNHDVVATRVENIAMASGIIAGLSAAGAAIAEPSGLSALGVWLGVTDEPLIVTAAPWLGSVATVSGTISGITYFYAKWKNHQLKKRATTEDL